MAERNHKVSEEETKKKKKIYFFLNIFCANICLNKDTIVCTTIHFLQVQFFLGQTIAYSRIVHVLFMTNKFKH